MVVFIDFQFSDNFANPDLHPCRKQLRHVFIFLAIDGLRFALVYLKYMYEKNNVFCLFVSLSQELVGKGIIPLMLANITHQPYLDNLKSKVSTI